MPSVVVTINHKSWEIVPLSAPQMRAIAAAGMNAEKERIKAGRTVSGGQSNALSAAYLTRKLKRGGTSVRDMVLSGATMDALQVKRTGKNYAKYGPTNPLARMILAVANKIEPTWGKSAEGRAAITKAVREQLKSSKLFREI